MSRKVRQELLASFAVSLCTLRYRFALILLATFSILVLSLLKIIWKIGFAKQG
jgi:hypothetical protein